MPEIVISREEGEVEDAGNEQEMCSLQRHREVPRLPGNWPVGFTEGEDVHVLLSIRKRQVPELPGSGPYQLTNYELRMKTYTLYVDADWFWSACSNSSFVTRNS
jgi:hypothetical protein